MTAAGDDTRLMTYAELGKARSISAASAKRLASRRDWPKTASNDGLARVYVPVAWLEASPGMSRGHASGGDAGESVSLTTRAVVQRETDAARTEVVELRVQLAGTQGELTGLRAAMRRADAAAEEARQRTGVPRGEREVARTNAAALRNTVAEKLRELVTAREAWQAAEVRAVAAEAVAKGLREALTEARRPFWRRWLGR